MYLEKLASIRRVAAGYLGTQPGSTGPQPSCAKQGPLAAGEEVEGGTGERRGQFSQKAIKPFLEPLGTTSTFVHFPQGGWGESGGEEESTVATVLESSTVGCG